MVENPDSGDHNLCCNLDDLLRLNVPEVQTIVLCLLIPYCGNELGIEPGPRLKVVFFSNALPVCMDFFT
jgi:hypothetical protein